MAWPSALTTNDDVLRFIFEQGVERMLEPGNTYTAQHEGVATQIRIWLERNGVPDTDLVLNPTDFAPAAAHLFFSNLIRSRDKALSGEYFGTYQRLMRETTPKLAAPDTARGGSTGRVRVIKQGSATYFTDSRSGVFPEERV